LVPAAKPLEIAIAGPNASRRDAAIPVFAPFNRICVTASSTAILSERRAVAESMPVRSKRV